MAERVTATPAAAEAIRLLQVRSGPLAMFQSGGCCDGSLPLCLPAGELPAGPHDVKLGEIDGMPFYVDGEQYTRWGEPSFLVDVSAGAPEGFSLAAGEGLHFVSRSPDPGSCPAERPGPA